MLAQGDMLHSLPHHESEKKAFELKLEEKKGELVRDDIDLLTGPNDTFFTWLIHSATQSVSSQPTSISLDLLFLLLPYILQK